jgi:WD40 repeat protein
LRHWDTLTDQERPVTQPKLPGAQPQFAGSFARSAIFSPDGHRLAVVENMGGTVRLAELDQGKELFAVPRGHAVAFSPDGLSLAVAEMTKYRELKLADGGTRSEFAPDTMVYVLDGRTGQERRKILVEGASLIEAVAFSPDGKTLAVGQGWNEPKIHLYDVTDGREVQNIATPARSHGSFALAFTPDGKRLVSGMSDTSILIWDVRPTD